MANESDEATVVTSGKAPDALQALGVHEAMITALALDGEMRGTLIVADRRGTLRPFGKADRRAFLTVANHVAMAVENSRIVDDLRRHVAANEHLAMHDALTGLPNRRLYQQHVESALLADPRRRALARPQPFQGGQRHAWARCRRPGVDRGSGAVASRGARR
jgi:GAF domain-containing protein